jgi:DNA-directed RNA polymerase subunit RPC12/RpoP
MTVYENDFSNYGYREISLLTDLLLAYKNNKSDITIEPLKIGFNNESGCVFLYDDDYRTFMLNSGHELEEWFNCPECGNEGFIKDITEPDGTTCTSCGRDILGILPEDEETP